MPIEVTCSSCQKRLRVPDHAAGKKIRCPKCRGVLNVPAAGAGAAAGTMWHVRTEEGETYGPIPESELDEWVTEGRVTGDSQILKEGSDQWQWASDKFPQLSEEQAAATPPSVSEPAAAPAPAAPAGPFDFGAADKGTSSVASRTRGRSRGRSRGGSRSSGVVDDSETSEKRKMVAGLLGLFLGGWGVHRFYLGYTGIGVIQILVTLFTCVGAWWGIIEGIMILAGSFDRDAQGRKLQD